MVQPGRPEPTANPYLRQAHAALPRLLAMFDNAPQSPTCGFGDRFHWAWKLIDFPNATFQGAANGLARLLSAGLLPEQLAEASVVRRISQMIDALPKLTRRNGSVEEAFPFEQSFCVTALVLYDLTTAIDLLGDRLSDEQRRRHVNALRPLAGFLSHNDETHGTIANHLATAAAALCRWADLSGDQSADTRAKALVDRLASTQSPEGWLPEYGGADPAYSSLALYYLADLHRQRPSWNLDPMLGSLVRFLAELAQPDGSFGGLYANRCGRFLIPAGFEALASTVPEAAAMATFARSSIDGHLVVTLDAVDPPNLIPFFNAYCWAAALVDLAGDGANDAPRLPAFIAESYRKQFSECGLVIDHGPDYHTIVNWHKGGVVAHWKDGQPTMIDGGPLARDRSGRWWSGQGAAKDNDIRIAGNQVTVQSRLGRWAPDRPGPWQFLILRLACVTVMRHRPIAEWIKRQLVGKLMGRSVTGPKINRTISLGPDLTIVDRLEAHNSYRLADPGNRHQFIHSASAGYWQAQDDQE